MSISLIHSTGPRAPYQTLGNLSPGQTVARPLQGKVFDVKLVRWGPPTPIVPCIGLQWDVETGDDGFSFAFSATTLTTFDAICATAILNRLFYKAADHFALSIEKSPGCLFPSLNILCASRRDQAAIDRLLRQYRSFMPANVESSALTVIGKART